MITIKQNKIIYNENFFILTGGPGAGKTTVLKELKQRKFRCVDEPARMIIREQPKEIARDPQWRKSLEFRELTLKKSIKLYKIENDFQGGITFFDRGIPDALSYPDLDKEVIKSFRYNQTVFIFPAWIEIYHKDEERIQSVEESVEVYEKVVKRYSECGYDLIHVPKLSVSDRADFIISNSKKLIKQ